MLPPNYLCELVRGQQQQANKSALASQQQPTTLSLCILVAASGRPNNHVPTVNSPVPLLLQLSICQLSPGSPLMTSVDIDFVQSGDQALCSQVSTTYAGGTTKRAIYFLY